MVSARNVQRVFGQEVGGQCILRGVGGGGKGGCPHACVVEVRKAASIGARLRSSGDGRKGWLGALPVCGGRDWPALKAQSLGDLRGRVGQGRVPRVWERDGSGRAEAVALLFRVLPFFF